MSLLRLLLGCFVAVLIGGGCGGGGGDSHHGSSGSEPEAIRTVDVIMRDIHFEPTGVAVKPGETVKFVFHNEGDIVHDAFIGDEAAQAHHENEMRDGGGEHHHDGTHAVTVDPGKAAELTYTFDEPATLFIGCHQAGHYAAGMKITVAVAA